MRSWLRFGVAVVGALVLLGSPLMANEANAQAKERIPVMVLALKPAEGSDDDFGKDLAKELRKLINEVLTHQSVDEDEIKDVAKRYDVDMEDLDCILGMQMSQQVGADIVFCGEYTEDKEAKSFSWTGVKFAASSSSFDIEERTWGEKEVETAAQFVAQSFDAYVSQLRRAVFCGEYYNNQDWASAEENCVAALAMNETDNQSRNILAMVLMENERFEEAYTEALMVIEQDPLHQQALQLAAYLASELDRDEEARTHAENYLMLNPNNVNVRMQLAYDLASKGQPGIAMGLIEEGLGLAPTEDERVQLHLQRASFATAVAQEIKGEMVPDQELPAELHELYMKVLESYDDAYMVLGEEMDVVHLNNMIAAYNELGQTDEAIAMAQRSLETHGDAETLWSLYGDVLKKAERIDEALMALEKVAELNPDHLNLSSKRGYWLLEARRPEEALPYLMEAIGRGERSYDQIAQVLFSNGYTGGGVNNKEAPKDYAYAQRLWDMALEFEGELSELVAGSLEFWKGFVYYQQGIEAQKPTTLQSAQSSLPTFRAALRLFSMPRVEAYAKSQSSIDIEQFTGAVQQYIEIQEALIQRGN